MSTMRQFTARSLGACALGAALVLAGAGAAGAVPSAPQSRADGPPAGNGGLLGALPVDLLRLNPCKWLEEAGLPTLCIWPKLDQINVGVPPELAALAQLLGVPGVNPLANP